MMRAARSVGAVLLVAQLACAGAASYQPRPSPRIAPLHINGRVYVRDGQRFEIGLLGGGGGEALVAGNETATALMRKHQRKQTASWILFGLGLGTSIAGTTLVFTGDDHERLGVGLAWLGLLPMAISLGFSLSARHDLVNAVNVYNDALEGPIAPDAFHPLPPPPGGR
jgi:hypothetical protein